MSVSSTTHGQEIEPRKELVQVLIRFWDTRSNARSGRNEDASSRAQVLADDVLSVMLAATTDHGRKGYVYAWGINDLSRTLAASRALQEAFDGFRGTSPAMKTTISVVLDRSPADELDAPHSSRSSLELTSLLDAAKPGQILITPSFYQCVDACQQLQLRSFPARPGVYEWLWTSGERLERLHSDPDFGPTLVQEPRAASTSAAVATVEITPSHAASTVPLQAPKAETPEAGADRLPLAKLRSRKAAMAAVLAVAVAAAAGAGFWFLQQKDHRPESRLTHPLPEPEMDALSSEAAEIPPAGAVEIFWPKAQFFPPVGMPSSGKVNQTCSSEDRFQIPTYLRMADANRSEGQYEASIRQYNRVLTCDPGNRAAREGKERALEDQRVSGQP